MLTLLQCVACAAVAIYLFWLQSSLRRRNTQTWDSMLARLRVDWNARELSDLCFRNEGAKATPAEKWRRIRGARGLWAMFQNAGVMLEMANYAARNSDSIDRELLAGLRSDATLIRIFILKTIAAYAFGAAQDSICAQALRTESIFMEMTLRMNEFLQQSAPGIVPSFSAAI